MYWVPELVDPKLAHHITVLDSTYDILVKEWAELNKKYAPELVKKGQIFMLGWDNKRSSCQDVEKKWGIGYREWRKKHCPDPQPIKLV